MSPARSIPLLLLAALSAAGCAGGAKSTDDTDRMRSAAHVLPTAGCGIEVTRWRIADGWDQHLRLDRPLDIVDASELIMTPPPVTDGEDEPPPAAATVRIALPTAPVADLPAIFARYAELREEDKATFAALHRNGIEIIRVARDRLPDLRDELGVARTEVRNWHGQACDWRELSVRSNDQQTRAIAVDGRVSRFVGGDFRLQFRGWLMLMEDGPLLQFELRGVYYEPAPRGLAARLQGREVRTLGGAQLELMLEPEYVYVVIGARPSERWPGRSGLDDLDSASIGPAVSMPPTLGRFMFDQSGMPPGRELLLLDPRIPDELMPQPLVLAGETR